MTKKGKKIMFTLICKNCRQNFRVYLYDKNRKYCCQECYHESRKGRKYPKRLYPNWGTSGKKFPKGKYPNHGMRNKKLSKKQIEELSNRQIERFKDPKKREKHSKACKGKCGGWTKGLSANPLKENYDQRMAKVVEAGKKAKRLPESRKKMSDSVKAAFDNSEYRKKRIKIANELWADPEFRKKQDKARLKNWADPEHQKMMTKAWNRKPNNLEKFYNEMTPDIVRYVGDGELFITTNKKPHNPDFKVSNQRKVIELFGNYWHEGEDTEELIREYTEVGWGCIIFWENEVYNEPEKVLKKTLKFIK